MDCSFALLAQFISDKTGLNQKEISNEIWERIVRERMALSHSFNVTDYYKLLQASVAELQELIEKLVVPETWFFRDPAAFEILVQIFHKSKKHTFKILSIPCSTGEEPYSIAMALLDAGFSAPSFRVDAMDISKVALEKATRALYSSHSFRGQGKEQQIRYFDPVPQPLSESFQLKKEVAELVHFSYGNIYDQNFLANKPLYDLIFCRNLLIYLHPEAQRRVVQNCGKILTEEGLLIVAPAEAIIAAQNEFVADQIGRGFVLSKHKVKRVNSSIRQRKRSVNESLLLKKPENAEKISTTLRPARVLADKGDFTNAENLCKQYVEIHDLDAEGYFLLGTIRQARGDEEEAETYFMKTVYLDPYHKEALLCLSLLAEKKGDKRQADLFRSRMRD